MSSSGDIRCLRLNCGHFRILAHLRRDNSSAAISSHLCSAWVVSFFQAAAVDCSSLNSSLNPCPTRNRSRAISPYSSRSFLANPEPSPDAATAIFRHQVLGSLLRTWNFVRLTLINVMVDSGVAGGTSWFRSFKLTNYRGL